MLPIWTKESNLLEKGLYNSLDNITRKGSDVYLIKFPQSCRPEISQNTHRKVKIRAFEEIVTEVKRKSTEKTMDMNYLEEDKSHKLNSCRNLVRAILEDEEFEFKRFNSYKTDNRSIVQYLNQEPEPIESISNLNHHIDIKTEHLSISIIDENEIYRRALSEQTDRPISSYRQLVTHQSMK